MHSSKLKGLIMSYEGFNSFCTQFEIFPQLSTITNLYLLYNNLLQFAEIEGRNGFDINSLVEALCLIALESSSQLNIEFTTE
jgi:hypothetical protein